MTSWSRSAPQASTRSTRWVAIDQDDIALEPLVALAAWQTLVDLTHVQPGQKVLIHAGAGGLGSTVVQLVKHLGAHVATTAHTKDAGRARKLGADEVIDYTTTDFASVLSGYDVVLDSVGGENLARSLTVQKPGGLAISVVGPPGPAFAKQLGQPLLRPVMSVMSAKVRRQARKLGVRYAFFFMPATCARSSTSAASPSSRPSTRSPTSSRARPAARSSSRTRPRARHDGHGGSAEPRFGVPCLAVQLNRGVRFRPAFMRTCVRVN